MLASSKSLEEEAGFSVGEFIIINTLNSKIKKKLPTRDSLIHYEYEMV
jgi:hypothetical protein